MDSSLTTSSNDNNWRLRQVADDYLAQRRAGARAAAAAAAAAAAKSTGSDTDDDTAAAETAISGIIADNKPKPQVRTTFDLQGANERLKEEKMQMVKFAFDAAATWVLENTYEDDGDSGDADFVMDTDTSSSSSMLLKKLPQVQDMETLEDMRVFSFVRAVENKDLTKRRNINLKEQARNPKLYQPQQFPQLLQQQQQQAAASARTSPAASAVTATTSASANSVPIAPKKIKTESATESDSVAGGGGGGGGAAKDDPTSPLAAAATFQKSPDKSTTSGGPGAAPKISRNTPASSLQALDGRITTSRAILCSAANVVFAKMTPDLPGGHSLDIGNVPQNPGDQVVKIKTEDNNNNAAGDSGDNSATDNTNDNNASASSATPVTNMESVIKDASTMGNRIQKVTETSMARSKRRYQYRKDCQKRNQNKENKNNNSGMLRLTKNPFAWNPDGETEGSGVNPVKNNPMDVDTVAAKSDANSSLTTAWKDVCLPRLLSVMETGFGNAMIHDAEWSSRHARIANLMQEFSQRNSSFGPHLIIATSPDIDLWMKEFKGVNSHLRLMKTVDETSLRALAYRGSKEERRKLRRRLSEATGLVGAAFHVVVTSYGDFLQDYLHFCQTPFEVVLVDDGCSWMAAAGPAGHGSSLSQVWDGLFSKNDHNVGLAGTFYNSEWNYDKEKFNEESLKNVLIGLTARHRLVTSTKLRLDNTPKNGTELPPVSSLLSFVAPHFAETVREEWDRSRMFNDEACMVHFRKLLARSFVVHDPKTDNQDLFAMAMNALQGNTEALVSAENSTVPSIVVDQQFVDDGKVANSRRYCLQWLGDESKSWLRYELGSVSFRPILDAMTYSAMWGHVCEEITTMLSTSNAGSTGHITGSLAYKFAVRCGKTFSTEQTLRPHVSSHHGLPGTWLCRTCGADCVTSLARTHHERSCGQPKFKRPDNEPPPSGNIARAKPGPKKKSSKTTTDQKDADGSKSVVGYRGVWMNPTGKFFIKQEKARVKGEDGSTLLFDSADDAAKKHDAILRGKVGDIAKIDYNFKTDGSRVVYDGVVPTASTNGIGGNADSVVPALSIINIRDLPKDVKPLLRDPRQTSRTGGNSKRHVYAYRGVCRQARKGHDRWQSQISFCGRNFYLGTYESEWDAAAIYAWAHLILYGKEATDQAQKEGEEAAAAFEKEQRDIAAGILPPPAPAPAKKTKQPKEKKPPKEKKKAEPKEKKKTPPKEKSSVPVKAEKGTGKTSAPAEQKKRPAAPTGTKPGRKKHKPAVDKDSLASVLDKCAGKAAVLVPHPQFAAQSDEEVAMEAANRIVAVHQSNYCVTDVPMPVSLDFALRPCFATQVASISIRPAGIAALVGLCASVFGWDSSELIAKQPFGSVVEKSNAASSMSKEYGKGGWNEKFQSYVQGESSVIGCASSRMRQVYSKMGLGSPYKTLGGSIGSIDCDIGGSSKCCGETAACIRYVPTQTSNFQLTALSPTDLVTLNGRRLTPELGSFPLRDEDICTIGPRVFVFLVPSDD